MDKTRESPLYGEKNVLIGASLEEFWVNSLSIITERRKLDFRSESKNGEFALCIGNQHRKILCHNNDQGMRGAKPLLQKSQPSDAEQTESRPSVKDLNSLFNVAKP